MKFSSDEYFSRLMIEIMNEDEEDIAFSQLWNVIKAEVYNQKHVEDEPYDCQLECGL